jgi:hypothetical protein
MEQEYARTDPSEGNDLEADHHIDQESLNDVEMEVLDDNGFFDLLAPVEPISTGGAEQENMRRIVVTAELARYKNVPAINHKDYPLEWWRNNQKQFPILCTLSQQFLTIPATSAPSEQPC